MSAGFEPRKPVEDARRDVLWEMRGGSTSPAVPRRKRGHDLDRVGRGSKRIDSLPATRPILIWHFSCGDIDVGERPDQMALFVYGHGLEEATELDPSLLGGVIDEVTPLSR